MTLVVKEERIEGAAIVLDESDWSSIREVLMKAAALGGFQAHRDVLSVRALVLDAREGIRAVTPPGGCYRVYAHQRCALDAIADRACPVCKRGLHAEAP